MESHANEQNPSQPTEFAIHPLPTFESTSNKTQEPAVPEPPQPQVHPLLRGLTLKNNAGQMVPVNPLLIPISPKKAAPKGKQISKEEEEAAEKEREKQQQHEEQEKKKQEERVERKKTLIRLRLVENLQKRKVYDLLHCVTMVPGVVFQFLQDYMIDIPNHSVPTLSTGMRIANSVSTPFLIWFTYRHYCFMLIEMKLNKEEYHKTHLFQSQLWKYFILECIVNTFHNPPFFLLTYTITILDTTATYTWDSIISIFALAKLYILLRIFQNYTPWTSYQAERICQMNGFTPDIWFAVKCIYKSNASIFLLIGFGLSVVLFGFAVQNFER